MPSLATALPASIEVPARTRGHSALARLEDIAQACLTASGESQNALRLEYLALIGEFLVEQQRGPAVLGPLLDIHESLDELYRQQGRDKVETERRSPLQPASPRVMARVSAVIDLMVAAGISADHAAQIASRQMLARGLVLPEEGGDSRGWKRVQIWHHRLVTIGRTHPQFELAQTFKAEMLAKHGTNAASLALSQPLWDRRTAV